jgi:hypothetical protein
VLRSRHLAFGDLAGAWSVLERLGARRFVDAVVGPRRGDVLASVGTYIALATANRVVAPCSKLAFGEWWDKTAGDRLVRLPAGATDHRRFWNAMDQISPGQLVEIEEAITKAAIETFSLNCDGLVLDMTNIATCIDSANVKARRSDAGSGGEEQ